MSSSATGTTGMNAASIQTSASSMFTANIGSAAVCVGIVGQNNSPLCIHGLRTNVGGGEDEDSSIMGMGASGDALRFHYILHTSLDVVHEKVETSGKTDPYLGPLFPTDGLRVYGYATCTHTKFILITDDVPIKDQAIITVCWRLMFCAPLIDFWFIFTVL